MPAPTAALRHADRRRRLALLLLRPPRMERERRRGQIARERADRRAASSAPSRRRAGDRRRRARGCSRSWSSAPVRPASRWPARSPRSPATRCAATSARSTRATARILLVEAADRVLTTFPPSLSAKAARSLAGSASRVLRAHRRRRRGTGHGRRRTARAERIPARTVDVGRRRHRLGLAARLAEQTGAEIDRAGRVTVEPELTLPGHPEVFALGDMVHVRGATASIRCPASPRSPCSRAATRRASFATGCGPPAAALPLPRQGQPRDHRPGRAPSRTSRACGSAASWPGSTWLVVHLWYLVGFQNRLLVLIRWSFSFATHGRGARLITAASTSDGADAG